ncbi:MAG: hypothetical protein LBI84_03830 [Propionibacteriaceae bacterium]|jgi:O-antigen/teichoic acid export membrane protein|nr:hypothetical protein [Propionibacteriaceae bacterium]
MKRDYFWNSVGTAVNSFLSLLLLIVVTRINGLDAAGIFSFGFGFALVFFTIGLYGGRIYQVSDIGGEFSSENYVALKFLTSAIMLVAAGAVILANHYDAYKSCLILALLLYRISEAIADAFYGVIQKHGRLFIVGISLTCKGGVGFLSFVVIDAVTKNLLLACLSLVLVNVLFMLAFDRVNVRKSERLAMLADSVKTHLANSLRLMKKCAYIFAFSFFATSIINIPRYFIDIYHEADQGYFGILIMPATLLSLFVTFIIQPSVLPLSEMRKNGRYDLFAKSTGRMLRVCLALSAAVIVGVYLIGVQVLTLIYGVDLTPYRLELTGVMLGGSFNVVASIYSNVLVIIRRQFAQLIVFIFSLALVAILCAVFVNTYGIAGGILSYIIANAVQGGLFIIVYKVIMKKERAAR